MPVEVSVIVPTYNRKERLVGLLEALARQTLERDRFEVIVVSDGSSDGTAEVARAAGTRLGLDLIVVEADHGGPARARNHGIARARAPVLAFTDDDVVPGPAWLEAGLAAIASPEAGGVEGRTDPELGEASLFHLNLSNPTGGIYPTCNMFYCREVVQELGGFDPGFRRYSDDSDLAFRVLDAGYRIPFEPRATVIHRSHLPSVLTPLRVASQLPDGLYLEARHPRRPRLRPRIYRSDVAKIGLATAAAAALGLGRAGAAALLAAAYLVLVLRTLASEVVAARVSRPGTFLALVMVYAVLPFANLYHLVTGAARARAMVAAQSGTPTRSAE